MDFINSKLLLLASNQNIIPRNKNQGSWLAALLPLSIILSKYTFPLEASRTYEMQSSVAVSLFMSFVLFMITSWRNKSSNSIKILASILNTLHLFDNGRANIFMIAGMSLTILSYEHCLIYIMRKCPRTFTLGEASLVLQGIILYLSGIILQLSNTNVMNNLEIATHIVQMGLLTLICQSLITYKYKYFRGVIPFYLLLSSLAFIFLVLLLYGLIKQNIFIWMFKFFVVSQRRVYLTVYWVISVVVATLAVRWQVSRAKKATTVSRKVFHVLVVMVYIPGLLFECTILYLASGVVFGLLILVELLRILNIPPFANTLQSIFAVYSDDKDQGTFALTQLYLLVGCSLPLWIHPALCDVTDSSDIYLLPLLAGLLSTGVGDTCASVMGATWGRRTWPGTQKTIVGTVSCILGQLIVLGGLYYSGSLIGVTRLQIYKGVGAIIVTSMVEAKTSQVDNLALPLIMYILLLL